MTKIALISDIHFGSLSVCSEFKVPCAAKMHEMETPISMKTTLIEKLKSEQVEHIIVTGDLTSSATPLEFYYCRETLKEIANEIGLKYENILVSFGNHDTDWLISSIEHKTDNEQDEQITKQHYLQIAGAVGLNIFSEFDNYTTPGPAPLTGIYENDTYIIVSLNTGWMSNKNDEQYGHLTQEQLTWFEKIAKDLKDSKKWKILMMHHHPFNYGYSIPFRDTSTLKEGPEVEQIVGENGFNIVCHGHRHHPRAECRMQRGWKNPVTFISSGSLSVDNAHRGDVVPNIFHILELNENKSFYLNSFQFDITEGWVNNKENNKHTPIDHTMFFLKPFEEEEVKDEIVRLCKLKEGEQLKILMEWRKLPEVLRSLSFKRLTELLEKHADLNNCQIAGAYPNKNVVIFQNDEKDK